MTTVRCVLGLISLSAWGCGAESDEMTAMEPAREGAMPGSACGVVNETRACSCAAASGAQACTAQGWTFCSCASGNPTGTSGGSAGAGTSGSAANATPAGNLRSDITFDWPRSAPASGSCEPGNYEGTFVGLYASGLTFVNAPIPVFALGTGLTPGLNFTLEQTADGETLRIANGKMTGTADGAFPFNGTITGTLNCKTNKFDAILDGYYSLGVDGVGEWRFKGPLLAMYDRNTHSMVGGTWDVTEYDPPPVFDGAGGEGTWDAAWLP
jgi:hypothetical protein